MYTQSSQLLAPALPDIPYLKFGEVVTLTNCDREPIHVPGHAQGHGALVVLDPCAPGLTVVQAGANLGRLCGIAVDDVVGQEAAVLFGDDMLTRLRCVLDEGKLESNPVYFFTGLVRGHGPFQASAHTYGGVLTVELEMADGAPGQEDAVSSRPDSNRLLRQALSQVRSATTLGEYCDTVCHAVQQICGFDRVMLYKFHDDGHGEVIGEVIGPADTREPYMGLHYPESDIPKQARALYLLNAIRLMPDALYEPSPLVPALNPLTGQPLDMTHCVLRGYSRMYTEYLVNMGARASMSLAIVEDGALWGLIACHHQTPRWVSHDVRAACQFMADVVSLQITDKEAHEDAGYRARIQDAHLRLVESMASRGNLLTGLTEGASADGRTTALSLIDAAGCAVVSENECRLLGRTPVEEEVRDLVRWLNVKVPEGEDVWETNALSNFHSPALAFKDRGAGMLALRVMTMSPTGDWVLWFRPEVAQVVNWGGNPDKPFEKEGPIGNHLSPRRSFSLWKETVSDRSLPWKSVEVAAARRLRTAFVEVILRRSAELVRLNSELSRSNIELDSFAYFASHDLKESLRGINNYIQFLNEDHGEQLSAEAQTKVDTLVRLTRRMDSLIDSLLRYSRIGRQELSLKETDLTPVLAEVLEALRSRIAETGVEMRVPRPLPTTVLCDAIQVGEVLSNLISNATKYNDNPAGQKWVEIGWLDPEVKDDHLSPHAMTKGTEPLVFYVRDNGIGIPEKHREIIFRIFKRLHGRGEYGGGTGAGLTIAHKIVERHGGRLWLESTVGEDTTFYFTLTPTRKDEVPS